MNKRGNLAIEKPPDWIIGLGVLLVIAFILMGGFAKTRDMINEITGIDSKSSNPSTTADCPANIATSINSLAQIYRDAANNPNNRCLIPFNPPGDIKDYGISIQNVGNAASFTLLKGKAAAPTQCLDKSSSTAASPQQIKINNVLPCVIGDVDAPKYSNFKKNWFENVQGITAPGAEISDIAITLTGNNQFTSRYNNDLKSLAKFDPANPSWNFLYKTTFEGKTYLCIFQDSTAAYDFIIPRRIPLCSQGSGPEASKPKETYSCRQETEGISYYFKSDDAYCFVNPGFVPGSWKPNSDPDRIKLCQSDGTWGGDSSSKSAYLSTPVLYRCGTNGIPFGKDDQCCCQKGNDNHCIKFDSSIKGLTACDQYDNVGGWVQKTCPTDERARVGYVNSKSGGGSW